MLVLDTDHMSLLEWGVDFSKVPGLKVEDWTAPP